MLLTDNPTVQNAIEQSTVDENNIRT